MAEAPNVYNFENGLEVHEPHNQPYHPYQQTFDAAAYARKGASDYVSSPAPREKRILGLRRQSFWLIVVLAIVVIAAAIGGGIGGSVAVQNARSKPTDSKSQPPSTTSPSNSTSPSSAISSISTAYLPPAATSVARIDIPCPQADGILQAQYGPSYFKCYSQTNYYYGDLAGITAYSVQQCIDACATMNYIAKSAHCIAFSISSDLASSYVGNHGANCWLKGNVTGNGTQDIVTSGRLCKTGDCADLWDSAA